MSASIQSTTKLPMLAGLQPRQAGLLAIYGIVLWFLAALMIRYGTPSGVFSRQGNVPVYAVTAASCFFLVRLMAASPRLSAGQLLPAVALSCLVALLCDGVAIAWLPSLYGNDLTLLLPGIAWLSFAVGLCLLFAMVAERR